VVTTPVPGEGYAWYDQHPNSRFGIIIRMYIPACFAPFPAPLADSLLDQALSQMGLSKERLENLSEEEKARLDNAAWRLVTAADVSDKPCHDD